MQGPVIIEIDDEEQKVEGMFDLMKRPDTTAQDVDLSSSRRFHMTKRPSGLTKREKTKSITRREPIIPSINKDYSMYESTGRHSSEYAPLPP